MNFHDILKESGDDGMIQSKKSKVKIMPSIKDGTRSTPPGGVFSTPKSNRIYVVTKHKWGHKKPISGNNNVYKGFSADTPIEDIKGFADRTKERYGKKQQDQDETPRTPFKSVVKECEDLIEVLNKLEEVLCD